MQLKPVRVEMKVNNPDMLKRNEKIPSECTIIMIMQTLICRRKLMEKERAMERFRFFQFEYTYGECKEIKKRDIANGLIVNVDRGELFWTFSPFTCERN